MRTHQLDLPGGIVRVQGGCSDHSIRLTETLKNVSDIGNPLHTIELLPIDLRELWKLAGRGVLGDCRLKCAEIVRVHP